MWFERHLIEVKPRAFIVDGSSYGLVQVEDVRGFFVKQIVILTSDTQPPLQVEIKRFESSTSFYVGKKGENIDARINVSAYKILDNAAVSAPKQPRPGITLEHINRASYEEEPILAKRVIAVDDTGEHYSKDNPIPVEIVNAVGLAPADFDEVTIIRDASEDPLSYNFFKNSLPVGVIEVTYDAAKSAIKYKRTS
jgi:hypothetical protein